MEPGEPQALPGRDPLEAEVAAACLETVAIVHDSLRSVQTAALDLRDAIVGLQRLQATLMARSLKPEIVQTLQNALEHGVALMAVFETMGLYEPVPIDLL